MRCRLRRTIASIVVAATIGGCSLISSFDGYGSGATTEGGVPSPDGSSSGETSTTDGNVGPDGSSSGADAPVTPVCPANPDPSLLAFFRFEDGTGKVAKDCSGKGNNGTIEGTGVFTTGHTGGGLKFDALTTCVDVGLGTAKNLTAFSVSAWVNVDDYDKAGTARYIAAYTTDADVRGWRFGSEPAGAFGVKLGQSAAPIALVSPTGRPTKTWIHVGAVYQKDTHVTIYVDGTTVATTATAPLLVEDGAAHLRVGCFHSVTSPNYHFSGVLDEVRVYSRNLSAPEMAALAL